MSKRKTFHNDLLEHITVFNAALDDPKFMDAVEVGVDLCVSALKNGNKLLLCGNGGSAADAQHIATELTVRYIKDRPAIAAIALTTDSSALTAAGNDLGFDRIFSRQVEALGRSGDVLIGISTSGRSQNVISAVEQARALGIKTIHWGGGEGGALASLCDNSIVVPSTTTARIQELHITVGHIFCDQIEKRLGHSASEI
ncbi:D-sedoheptulose 7-phosphate isomerase [Sagittula sp. MA-2]|jgi:D-sedoheptulose 7-phosphate isomerase|uniref:D-sedoheptulose 7-phosphate isomerase n=1 Tax=Sagittula sp. MA-2 TaxID=3048007 RepID=UPI0024C29B15|nr:D-sedoheptulose 7-phosphate isomerase [Sagittula sp. MA-2]WHZ37721.1 D-sedoheptulose 7-phosphate isomerase [Sagittula sp. MA-2]